MKTVALTTLLGVTENDILAGILHPSDVGADWLGRGTYQWYFTIGSLVRPRSIVELGTRYGYSLAALVKGSQCKPVVWTFDGDVDGLQCNAYVARLVLDGKLDIQLFQQTGNLRQLRTLRPPVRMDVDLVHVDADHSTDGTYADCQLAYEVLKPGGVMLIDDIHDKVTRDGAFKFVDHVIGPKLAVRHWDVIDTYRGMYVIRKPLPSQPSDG